MNRRGGVLSALPPARSVGTGPALSGERVALSVLSLPVKALSGASALCRSLPRLSRASALCRRPAAAKAPPAGRNSRQASPVTCAVSVGSGQSPPPPWQFAPGFACHLCSVRGSLEGKPYGPHSAFFRFEPL